MGFKSFVVSLIGWLRRAFAAAAANGLTDEVVRDAYWLAKKAAETIDGEGDTVKELARREWVVRQLTARGIPESIARTSLELAVQILKREKAGA